MKDKPALHSVCLANEPAYNASGRDQYTRPLFIDYLKEKHHQLDRMNALYGTAYTNFDQAVVPPCAMPAEAGRNGPITIGRVSITRCLPTGTPGWVPSSRPMA